MDVLFNNEFNSIVKATILKEVRGYNPVINPTNNYCLTDDFSMNELLIEWDWKKGTPHNINNLREAIKLALRHKHSSINLIMSIISQALTWGVDYVLTRRTIESKRFCNMIIAVRDELRRAKMNIRFQRFGNTIIGKYYFSHKITDLLQEFYQKRFPNKKVLITNNSITSSLNRLPVKQPSRVINGVNTQLITLKSFL